MKRLIALAVLCAASFGASAHDVDVSAASSLPTYEVAEFESVDGEGRTAFLKRVTEQAAAYTEETGFEVCGWVAYGGAHAFSLKLVTLKSQVGCSSPKSAVVSGYVAGDETYHTHPVKRNLRLNAVDRIVRGKTLVGREGVNNCSFSDQDYTQPGYLVACGKLMHQRGKGTAKEL